ncbi:MAG: hypothetical protein Kow0069_31610 [Promethearchaeota archaeon]
MAFFEYSYQWLAYVGSGVGAALAYAVSGALFKRHAERRSPITRNLSWMVFLLGTAATVDFTFFSFKPFMGELQQFVITLGTNISFTCSATSNLLLFLFTLDVFADGRKSVPAWFVLGAEAFSAATLIPLYLAGLDSLPVLVVHLAASFAIYSSLAKAAFKLRGRLRDEGRAGSVELNPLAWMGASGILFFTAISLFLAHEVFLLLAIREYWTVTFGWITGSVAGFCTYVGYVVPEWAKRRWSSAGGKTF